MYRTHWKPGGAEFRDDFAGQSVGTVIIQISMNASQFSEEHLAVYFHIIFAPFEVFGIDADLLTAGNLAFRADDGNNHVFRIEQKLD